MISREKLLKTRRCLYWLVGFCAFLWVLLRSGTNPKRLSYPCQQAASSVAVGWLVAVMALLGGGMLYRRIAKCAAGAALIVGLIWLIAAIPLLPGTRNEKTASLPVWEVDDPISTVFVMDSIPPTAGSLAAGDASVPDEYLVDPAIDTLLLMMEEKGVYLHKTGEHPSGVVGAGNVVIIKGNFQWTSRNTTSTDRIKGLIWRILQHPDGFSGEILICDNTQDIGTGIGENDNNSEDEEQSIPDVVGTFYAKGYPVYYWDWSYMWDLVVDEYSDGDYADGYVYEMETKISYPKFRSPSGGYYISLRHGVWDSTSAAYDSSRICIIDFPVLKAHSMAGSTIAIKNWIGMLTTAYADDRYGGFTAMHYDYLFGDYALVAKVMEVTYPRLVILDAAWTSTRDAYVLSDLVNTKMLLASKDPSAVSWYSAKFILTPIARFPQWTNPDVPGGKYNSNLTGWTTYLREAGFPCTRDSSEMSVYDREVLNPTHVDSPPGTKIVKSFRLHQNYPNPFNPKTTISFELPGAVGYRQHVSLSITDLRGRHVRKLLDTELEAGSHKVVWDGRDEMGLPVASGIYFYTFRSGEKGVTRKMSIIK